MPSALSLSLSVSLYYLIYLLPLPLCLSPFKCCPARRPNIYQLKLNIAEGEDTFEIEHFRDGAIIPFLDWWNWSVYKLLNKPVHFFQIWYEVGGADLSPAGGRGAGLLLPRGGWGQYWTHGEESLVVVVMVVVVVMMVMVMVVLMVIFFLTPRGSE